MRIYIKVFTSDHAEFEQFGLDCRPEDAPELAKAFCDHLTTKFPGNDLKLIKLGPKRYNIIPQPQAIA